jgi:hypothetical protein
MVDFIDQHRAEYGIEPICAVLPIAPSIYYEHKARAADPSLRSARAKRDDELREEIGRVWHENFCVYGTEKVW